jgi:hypothetical protein
MSGSLSLRSIGIDVFSAVCAADMDMVPEFYCWVISHSFRISLQSLLSACLKGPVCVSLHICAKSDTAAKCPLYAPRT